MGLDPRHISEKVAHGGDAADPDGRAQHVKGGELAARHLRHARHKRHKSAQKRHEPGGNDGHAAVLFIKRMRLVEGLFVEKPRVFPLKHLGPEVAPHRVVALVAQHRGHKQHGQGQRQAHQPHAAHGPHHKQQRIPR